MGQGILMNNVGGVKTGDMQYSFPRNKPNDVSQIIESGENGVGYMFVPCTINDGRVTSTMTLQGSNDNAIWNDVTSVTARGSGNDYATKMGKDKNYKYYRISGSGGNMGVNTGWAWGYGVVYKI